MRTVNITKTSIKGLLVINRPTYFDNRGFFREVARFDELEKITGVGFKVKQWNHSVSKPGVIRAIHAENWNKLIYPISGKMFAAIVDIRPKSKTFGRVEEFVFDNSKSNPDGKALFIQKGLANSICAFGNKSVHYLYLVDKYYDGTDTRAVAWNDTDLNIKWPVRSPIVSDRDKNNPTMRELFPRKYK